MQKNKIRCPYCSREYLPAEIFVPKIFFGTPRDVVKSDAGDVLGYNGDDMFTEEEYICDGCDKKFKIYADITFKVEAASEEEDIFAEDADFIKGV